MKWGLCICICACLFLIVLATFFFLMIGGGAAAPETLLERSTSPNETYTVEVYRTEPGATVDFSVKGYLVEEHGNKLIYFCYHESQVNLFWESDDVLRINGKRLDLSAGETYDWRKD